MSAVTLARSLLVGALLPMCLVALSFGGSVTFVSSNQMKIKEVRSILADTQSSPFPFKLHCENFELIEPQSTPVDISRTKCKQAVQLCRGPVIVEDTSLHFNGLNGMPGPYIKAFYESLGNEGLAGLLDFQDDRSAYAQCVVSFSLGVGHEIKTFVGTAEGTILRSAAVAANKTAASQGFGWDPIFIPNGFDVPFGQMDMDVKNKLSHRFKAFRQLKQYINSNTPS